MADDNVIIKDGTATPTERKIDTRTVNTDEHRQVFVLGDQTDAAGIAPVDATNGARVYTRPDLFGATAIHKDAEYTTTQTGGAVWTPAAGKKFVVTDMTIATGGTTPGTVTIWQGAAADTTYTQGTDRTLFRGEFVPSSQTKPGFVKSYRVPFVSSTADHVLRITTNAAITVYIQVEGYEI